MPNIEVNGEVVAFPDTMSEDQITAAIKGMTAGAPATPAPPPSVSAGSEISNPLLRYPAMAGSELLKGIDIGLGIPGDLESLAVQHLVNPLAQATGLAPTSPTAGPWGTGTLLPTSGTMLESTGRLGLTDRPDLTPGWGANPRTENVLAAGARGVGSAAPMAVLAPEALPVLGAGAVGGVAGEITHEALPGNSLAPIGAGLVAGGGAQGVKSLLSGNTVERIATGLGSSKTLQDAGEALQDAARQWRTVEMPAAEASAWAPVNRLVPPDAPVHLTNFSAALNEITKRGGDLKPVIDALGKQLPDRLEAALQNKTPIGLGLPTRWDNARFLRSYLGDHLDDPELVRSIGQQNLNQLYGAVTKDLQGTATGLGAGDAFAQANAESARLHQFAEGPLSRVISDKSASVDPNIKPEDVASRLLSGGKRGATDLAALRGELPDAVDELAAAHLRVQPQGWTKLAPEAKSALVPDVQARGALDSLAANPPVSLRDLGTHALQSVVGGEAGGPLALLGGKMLGVHGYGDELTAEAVGRILGVTAPWAWRNAARVVRNPGVLALPVAGGVGGATALFPGRGP